MRRFLSVRGRRLSTIPFRYTVAVLLCLVICCSAGYGSGALCAGDFSQSCSDMMLVDGKTLQAWCGDGQGNNQHTSLDLDQHVTNNNGALQCSSDSGAFSASCVTPSLVGPGTNTLAALCLDVSGNLLSTSLDLDSCVQNTFGSLAWACV